jgi:hypothetical protein
MPQLVVDAHGSTKVIHPDQTPTIPAPYSPEEPSFSDSIAEFARRQAYREKTEKSVTEAYIETPANRVGLLVASGDKHIGADGFDWAKFQYDTDLILKTPDVWELEMGDIVDNLFFNKDEDIMNVREQIGVLNAWAKVMVEKGKVLATISGNHQEWMFGKMGVEFYMLAFGYGGHIPHLRDGGDIFWKYGNVLYRINSKHKTKYNSDLNPHHTNHRTFWMACPEADVILSAHTHSLSQESWSIVRDGKDRDVHFGKTGSYKAKDRYRDANGFIPNWQTGALCYTFHPFKKEIWSVTGVERGVRLQGMLNWELEKGKEIPVGEIVRELSNG